MGTTLFTLMTLQGNCQVTHWRGTNSLYTIPLFKKKYKAVSNTQTLSIALHKKPISLIVAIRALHLWAFSAIVPE